jgi:uncharacterized membrane protein YbaN (DUF454 family)
MQSPLRLFLGALGVICLGLAIVGAILPVMPATIFLILAAYFFARSYPALHEKLVNARMLRPFQRYLHGEHVASRNVRIASISGIWLALGTSCLLLASRGRLSAWILAGGVTSAVLGTVMILRSPRHAKRTRGAGGRPANSRPS